MANKHPSLHFKTQDFFECSFYTMKYGKYIYANSCTLKNDM